MVLTSKQTFPMTSIDTFFLKCIPTNIAPISSNNSAASTPRLKRKVTAVVSTKITIDQVIKNQLDPPVSYQGFFRINNRLSHVSKK